MYLHVPKDKVISTPIQLIYLSTGSSEESSLSSSFPRLVVDLEENGKLVLKQSYATVFKEESNKEDMSNLVIGHTSVNLRKHSSLHHCVVQDLSETTRSAEVINVKAHEYAQYAVDVLQMGSKINKINVHVNLTEGNSSCAVIQFVSY